MPATGERGGRLLVRGGRVVDPSQRLDAVCDLELENGVVAGVGDDVRERAGDRTIDARGALVIPGVVDSHVHLTDISGARPVGGSPAHRRLVAAGVTTAVEFFDFRTVLDQWHDSAAGLTVLGLQGLRPHRGDAGRETLTDEVAEALRGGAIGIKVLGGHFPNTPETCRRVIAAADDLGAYAAFHAGTTDSGSDLEGMREAIDLAEGRPIHLAHTNAYLRGATADVVAENASALELLMRSPRVVSESHLATMNLCVGGVEAERLTDHIVANCLVKGGYPRSPEGLERAFLDEYAHVLVDSAAGGDHITGEAARQRWRSDPAGTLLGFPVNNPYSGFVQACARSVDGRTLAWDGDGSFVVDAISSDGGYFRNVILERGLSLVRWGGMSLTDLVGKITTVPAQLFGLTAKGSLAPGQDADVAVVHPGSGEVRWTIAGGRVVYDGVRAIGSGGKVLTTPAGVEAVRACGIDVEAVDLSGSVLRSRRRRWTGP